MEGRASISPDIVTQYAADAALQVGGVHGLVEGRLPSHKAVRLTDEDGRLTVELHVRVDAGASIPRVGTAVQSGVRDYLARMADLEVAAVNVVVDEIASAGP